MKTVYDIQDTDPIISPQLLYYTDYIEQNILNGIRIAGSADKLWPHAKTHKTREIIRLCIEHGITRFKCATIAEAEVAASCGPTDIILAYPLIGPNVERFLTVRRSFPAVRFWSIGDDLGSIKKVSDAAVKDGAPVNFLIDVNCGQDRTGVDFERLEKFYAEVGALEGIELRGMHVYDGHIHQSDLGEREWLAAEIVRKTFAVRDALQAAGLCCDTIVMGGTPTFPCYAKYDGVYCAPGTIFLNDHNYDSWYPEMAFVPAGIILSRVVSHPAPGLFTIDCGHKAIGADPEGVRGVIAGMEDFTEPLSQSEEHWVFRVLPGYEDRIPAIGEVVYVIPSHICPSNDRYPFALTVRDGRVTGKWEIAARNRKITY